MSETTKINKKRLVDYDSYDTYPDETIKGNEKALSLEHSKLRDQFNKEYYINKNEKKAREIESTYNDEITTPLDKDLVEQRKEYDRKKNTRFSGLKKLLRGE